ncbi:MAG: DNA repair exonuclease [Candidatus Schekmanbacteria bacterium]|nr:DNA repair exonuclease [Candidatus Schekmanbacteria bacterium]
MTTQLKFLHAADIHLDSPMRGLARYGDLPIEDIRCASRRACEQLVQLAIEEEAAFVVVAGDLYDEDWRDYNTGLFLVRQMAALRDAGIQVFVVKGNHDAASRITKSLRLPDNVRVFAERKPETMILEELGIAIHGQSFAAPHVPEDLSAAYPSPRPGLLNVGVLHSSLDGRPGHDVYAPCTSAGLRGRGYDYWALGHVHRWEIVAADPWIVFPGNVQGRHARETGPKGCALVTVDDGRVAAVERRELDVVRWAEVAVDSTGCRVATELLDRAQVEMRAALGAAGGRPVVARVVVTGASALRDSLVVHDEKWRQELRAAAADVGRDRLWIEKVRVEAMPAAAAGDGQSEGAAAAAEAAVGAGAPALRELLAALSQDDAEGDDEVIAELVQELAPLRNRLPAELAGGVGALDLTSPDLLRQTLREARALLGAVLFPAEAQGR